MLRDIIDKSELDTDFYILIAPNKEMKLRASVSVPLEHTNDTLDLLEQIAKSLRKTLQ